MLSLTSHADVKWVQSCCKYFHYDFIRVADDGETGIFSEPQHVIASIFINNPGGHNGPAELSSTKQSGLAAIPGE